MALSASDNKIIVFNGVFGWEGKKKDKEFPIIWWPGSYRITLINQQAANPELGHIKPYLCLFSGRNSKYNIKTRFERFAVQVAQTFSINPEKVLWIELISQPPGPNMEVAMLETITRLRNETLYKPHWRPIRPNEIDLLKHLKAFLDIPEVIVP